MGIDVSEPISKEEMERFTEDTLALWRTQYNLFVKIQMQGAPKALVQEMSELSERFREIHGRLEKLCIFFPKENDS